MSRRIIHAKRQRCAAVRAAPALRGRFLKERSSLLVAAQPSSRQLLQRAGFAETGLRVGGEARPYRRAATVNATALIESPLPHRCLKVSLYAWSRARQDKHWSRGDAHGSPQETHLAWMRRSFARCACRRLCALAQHALSLGGALHPAMLVLRAYLTVFHRIRHSSMRTVYHSAHWNMCCAAVQPRSAMKP
jgi:hypothetical protein